MSSDEDLNLIFSRFGKILSCEVIRDKRTGDSLQYAFIEFEHQKDCEQAYFKMQGVLIDDHRIHVDFSQSVSKLSDSWREATNSKRSQKRGGFGGISGLEKKRQYKAAYDDEFSMGHSRGKKGYRMVFDKDEVRRRHDEGRDRYEKDAERMRSRSRSPSREKDDYRDRRDRDHSYLGREPDHNRDRRRRDD